MTDITPTLDDLKAENERLQRELSAARDVIAACKPFTDAANFFDSVFNYLPVARMDRNGMTLRKFVDTWAMYSNPLDVLTVHNFRALVMAIASVNHDLST